MPEAREALWIASTMRRYPPQRHRLPSIAARISASPGLGFWASNDVAAMIIPGMQNPHWNAPASTNACSDRMKAFPLRQALDGGDGSTHDLSDGSDARADGDTVHEHLARPALPFAAAVPRAGEPQLLAQNEEQAPVPVERHRMVDTVDA